jgi:hypothetical protein
MKTSILERKINEDPLAWGTPDMIIAAKKRKKSGLSLNLNTAVIGSKSTKMAPNTESSSLTKQKSEAKIIESDTPAASVQTVPYPEIRAKYDLKITGVKTSKAYSQSDKKAKIKNLEFRYQNEVKEQKYKKYTLLSLAGFLAMTVVLLYVKNTLI